MSSADLDARLRQALACHQAGQLAHAEPLYRQILAAEPRHPDALQLLGVLSHQAGRVTEAIDLMRRSLEIAPQPAVYYNFAGALADDAQLSEAIAALTRAQALAPDFVEAGLNHGALLERQGDLAGAEQCYRRVLTIKPRWAAAWSNLGAVLHRQQRLREALQALDMAIDCDGGWAPARANRASVLRDLGQNAAAIEGFRQALAIDSKHYAASHNLGELLQSMGQTRGAIDAYRQALDARPDAYETLNNLASAYSDLGDTATAKQVAARACSFAPDRSEAHGTLGVALQDEGRFAEALACFERAIALRADDGEAHLNRALVWIQLGRLAEGWREYEWRWRAQENARRPRTLAQRPWQGESLRGRRVLVHAEQGVGDEIMFATCVGDLVAEGADVTLTCDNRLAPLFQRSMPRVRVMPVSRGREDWNSLSRIAADYQVAVGSLPRYLRTTEQSFRRAEPLLVADPQRVAHWRRRLSELGPGPYFGFAWRGGKKPKEIRDRSIPRESLGALLCGIDADWVDLQYGEHPEDRACIRGELAVPIHRFTEVDPLVDLDETAALISALDRVVTVGSAAAHLAGALGVDTWVLLPRTRGWRWFLDRADSPWYRSLRLWRQPSGESWEALLPSVRAALVDSPTGGRCDRGDRCRRHD